MDATVTVAITKRAHDALFLWMLATIKDCAFLALED
jgi:hypothetical protein